MIISGLFLKFGHSTLRANLKQEERETYVRTVWGVLQTKHAAHAA